MDCSPPGSSVRGILQARILEWVAMPSSRDFPNSRIELRSPTLQVDSLPSESLRKPKNTGVRCHALIDHKINQNAWLTGFFFFLIYSERVTGRKARGPQVEEIDCKWQTFFLLSSQAAGRNTAGGRRSLVFPSLYKMKRRFLLHSVLKWQRLVLPELNCSQTLS